MIGLLGSEFCEGGYVSEKIDLASVICLVLIYLLIVSALFVTMSDLKRVAIERDNLQHRLNSEIAKNSRKCEP